MAYEAATEHSDGPGSGEGRPEQPGVGTQLDVERAEREQLVRLLVTLFHAKQAMAYQLGIVSAYMDAAEGQPLAGGSRTQQLAGAIGKLDQAYDQLADLLHDVAGFELASDS